MKIRSNPRFQGHKPRQADFVPDKTEIEIIQGLESIREKIQTCIQCGTCTGSCPNADAMDLTPRHLWRLVIMGKTRQVFESRTFALHAIAAPSGVPGVLR
jgi:heterodisulfide reductase subunit C